MSYVFSHADQSDRFNSTNKNSYPVFKLLLITKPELRTAIKEQKLASIDVIELLDNFGIRYSAKTNLISSHDKPNISIYLLASNRHYVLSYENIDSLLNCLHTCGYQVQKQDLKIISYYSGI